MENFLSQRFSLFALLTAFLFATGAVSNISKAGSTDAFANVSVQELSELIAQGDATPIDANSSWFREKHGVIPGAKLLSNYRRFDLAELPADKSSKIVFYCSNTVCTAAPIAAGIAQKAGYKDVNVLPVGLVGWKQAGEDVDKI